MIDIIGNKAHYRPYQDNFRSQDKDDISLKKFTDHENDETDDSVMDLHTVIQRSSWKALSPKKVFKQSRNLGRSFSWTSSTRSSQDLGRRKRNYSLDNLSQQSIVKSKPLRMATSHEPRHFDGRFAAGNLTNSKYIIIEPPSSKRNLYEKEKRNWGSLDPRDTQLLKGKSFTREKAISQTLDPWSNKQHKSNNMSLTPQKVRSDSRNESPLAEKDRGGRFSLESQRRLSRDYPKIQDNFNSHSTGAKNSPVIVINGPKLERYSTAGSSATQKNKIYKASKTTVFDQKHEDLDPDDIALGIQDKETVKPKMFRLSPDQSVVHKEDQNAKFRYDKNFFKNHIVNRTGVPTITAKKRETTIALNFNNFDSDAPDSQEYNLNPRQLVNSRTMNFSLLKEMASIEMQKNIKMKMEQFVLLFNKNADLGINYLISSKLVEDTPEKVAQSLLVTEGLNKEMIGQYLGSYKEKNKIILKAYCELLDFRNLEFDQALRLLLSRFKLPGEAQQIERIVGVFASVYHSDNPKVFTDEDTPFILAYSLLMLNTDAHSSTIQSSNKMTRNQFIENNMKVCNLSREYLGRMYDNIVKQKFETKADYIETIYNRLHQGNFSIQGESLKSLFDLAKVLMRGAVFVKYGRKGKSHERRVWISDQEDAILWTSHPAKGDRPRVMPFSEIRDVLVGHNCTEVLIKNKVPSEFDPVILSVITTKRTLDLRAPDVDTRVKWERYFRLYLLQRKDKSKGIMGEGKKRQKEKEKLSECKIWKVDVLPNWESHWDYENRKPKHVDITAPRANRKSNKNAKKSGTRISACLWGFFKRKKKVSKKYEKQSLNRHSENDEEIKMEDEFDDDEDEDLRLILANKDKSLLLVTLWRKGIPDWLRSILWPISLGNQLEITQNLYEILLSQAKEFLKDPSMTNSTIFDSLRIMQMDLRESIEAFPMLKDRKEAIVNILDAFIFYRPDVGYVKGMCRLVMVLLLYCNEFQTFLCFINLIHSHHFISFFRGIMREIEWRIRFFNKVFAEELPHLFNHFKALDLSSEMFLLEWFLSLFSMAISDTDIISRIWDCFLLEGEVYAIKTGVAILKYFEFELKMLTFDGAVKFLKALPKDLDEDMLFSCIDKVNVSLKDYHDEVRAQKVAEINSKVHQALLEN